MAWNSSYRDDPPLLWRLRRKTTLWVLPIALGIGGAAYWYPPLEPWRSLILVSLVTAELAWFVGVYFWAEGFRRRVAAGVACPNCGYNTTGLVGANPRCPECGYTLTVPPAKVPDASDPTDQRTEWHA